MLSRCIYISNHFHFYLVSNRKHSSLHSWAVQRLCWSSFRWAHTHFYWIKHKILVWDFCINVLSMHLQHHEPVVAFRQYLCELSDCFHFRYYWNKNIKVKSLFKNSIRKICDVPVLHWYQINPAELFFTPSSVFWLQSLFAFMESERWQQT